MRRLRILFVILLSSSLSFAQNAENEEFIQLDEQEQTESVVKKKTADKKKVQTNIAIGTSIMSMGKNQFSMNTYVKPTISYQLTPKFSVSMGLMAVRSNFNNLHYLNYYEGQVQSVNYDGTSAYFTMQGAYQLNDKMKIYGGVMIGNQNLNFAGAQLPNQNNQVNPKAFQLGMEYKLGENTFIQLEVQIREANPIQDMQMQSSQGFGIMNRNPMFGSQLW